MTSRVNVNSIRPTSSAGELIEVPWEASTTLTDSAVIKNAPGVLGGVTVNFTWGLVGPFSVMGRIRNKVQSVVRAMVGQGWPFPEPPPAPTWWLIVWDSPDDDTTDDVVLLCYPFPTGAYLGNVYPVMFPLVGIKAHKGIYVEVCFEDAVEYTVYYR